MLYIFCLIGEDFIIDRTTVLTFSPEDEKLAVPFRILSDSIAEDRERFRLSLSISENRPGLRLNLEKALTTIYINDDDCKW